MNIVFWNPLEWPRKFANMGRMLFNHGILFFKKPEQLEGHVDGNQDETKPGWWNRLQWFRFVVLLFWWFSFFFHETSKIDPKKRDLRRNNFFSMSTLTTSNAMKCWTFYTRLSFTYQMSTKDGSKQALNSIEEHDACLPSLYLLGIGNKLMNSH